MKNWKQIFLGAGMLVLAPALHSQAVPTGIYESHIQAGAGVLILNNDYTERGNKGLSAWIDYDFNRFLGVEVVAHFGSLITPDDVGENSYLVGPRLMYHKRRFTAYGKILVGRGTIINQLKNQSSTYNIIPAYGAGLEYRVMHKIDLRLIDVEFQKWPGLKPDSLSPMAITFGLSYIIR